MAELEVSVPLSLLERLAGYTYELPQRMEQAAKDRKVADDMIAYVRGNAKPEQRYIVLARTYADAARWINGEEKASRFDPRYKIIKDPWQLDGLHIDDATSVVVLDGFWDRNDAGQVWDTLYFGSAKSAPGALTNAINRGNSLVGRQVSLTQ